MGENGEPRTANRAGNCTALPPLDLFFEMKRPCGPLGRGGPRAGDDDDEVPVFPVTENPENRGNPTSSRPGFTV